MSLIGAAAFGMSAAGAWAATTHQVTEAYAKTQILGDNYTNVTDMQRTRDGWTAKAMEGGKQVTLSVNDMGDVNKV
jgi:hypothetical protein